MNYRVGEGRLKLLGRVTGLEAPQTLSVSVSKGSGVDGAIALIDEQEWNLGTSPGRCALLDVEDLDEASQADLRAERQWAKRLKEIDGWMWNVDRVSRDRRRMQKDRRIAIARSCFCEPCDGMKDGSE